LHSKNLKNRDRVREAIPSPNLLESMSKKLADPRLSTMNYPLRHLLFLLEKTRICIQMHTVNLPTPPALIQHAGH